MDTRLDGKTVIITGANSGIGRATAFGIARTGARVILACRNRQRAEEARQDIVRESGNGDVHVRLLDLADMSSVKKFAEGILASEERVDILINNAGVTDSRSRQETVDGFELHFAVNYLGHFLLTLKLLERLKACAPSRILNIAAEYHKYGDSTLNISDINNKHCHSFPKAYGRSKTAQILFSQHLGKLLEGTGVTTYAIHPGLVDTNLGSNHWCVRWSVIRWLLLYGAERWMGYTLKSPTDGARTTLHCALDPSLASQTGKYYSDCSEAVAGEHATNPATAIDLWMVSLDMVWPWIDDVSFAKHIFSKTTSVAITQLHADSESASEKGVTFAENGTNGNKIGSTSDETEDWCWEKEADT